MTITLEKQANDAGLRGQVKRILRACLSDRGMDIILSPWRRFYWRRRTHIDPKKNARIAARIVASGKPIKLELGSWKRAGMEDWIASDWGGGGDIQLDLTQPLPFPDNSVEKIYSSHVLEHFSYPHPMLDLLRECRRILKPGGTFSLAVPNARIFIDAYNDDSKFDRPAFCGWDVGLTYRSKIDYLNFIAYMGGDHKHLFDEPGLLAVLAEAGFSQVSAREFDATTDLEVRRLESIYARATK